MCQVIVCRFLDCKVSIFCGAGLFAQEMHLGQLPIVSIQSSECTLSFFRVTFFFSLFAVIKTELRSVICG